MIGESGARAHAAEGARVLWLVGMMGAGKSTVGPILARRLGRRFIDTDDEIAARAGSTIPEIFEREGEVGFRARERREIERAALGAAVVALGGGAIAQPGLAEWLAERGVVVYLRAAARSLCDRIGDASTRPLLAGLSDRERLARIEEILRSRERAYETASIVVETDRGDFDAEQVADAILERLAGEHA